MAKTKLCCKAGCGCTAIPGKDYCMKHIQLQGIKRKVFTYRGSSGAYNNLYHSSRWRRESKEFLSKYNVCFICGAKSTIVDHIIPHKGDLNLFWDRSNWQPMCQRCHSRKTFAENNYFRKK